MQIRIHRSVALNFIRYTIKTTEVPGQTLPKYFLALCILFVATSCSYVHQANESNKQPLVTVELAVVDEATVNNSNNYSQEQEKKFIENLLSQMTLQQKVAQMIQAEIKHITPEQVKQYSIGSVLNGGGSHPNANKHASVKDWRELASEFHEASSDPANGRLAIPVLWGTDAVHGHNNVYGATIFPHNIGLGAANNPALTEAIYKATAKDVRTTGIKWAFAPTVAVARDDRWGRTYESFSEDPRIVAELSTSAVRGLQGNTIHQLGNDEKVIATAKHFIGDGGTINGIDQGDTVSSESQLLNIHGKSFINAIEAGAQTVMASFNSWNGTKLHGHKYLLTDVLKQQFGFDGFVIGDWNGHAQIPGCSKTSCPAAINAGIDMFMAPEDWQALLENTVAQVISGEIPAARINDAARRILSVKYRAGLFNPDANVYLSTGSIDNESHQELARQAVKESLVLIKNNNDTLPIQSTKRVLVIGEAANSIAMQSGGWTLSWQGNDNENKDFPNGSTILDGVRSLVETEGGSVSYGSANINPEELSAFDTAIFVFGEEPYAEGAGDIGELSLPSSSHSYVPLLKQLKKKNIPVTSIMLTGRPLSSNKLINLSDAFVVAWLPGSEGAAVADLIIGDTNKQPRNEFTGKLAFSWPESASSPPINNYPFYQQQPQFEVGYGLNYKQSRYVARLPELDEPKTLNIAAMDNLPIFVKKVAEPWEFFVGDEEDWSVAIKGNSGSTLNQETVTISATDHATQEDARLVKWRGDGTGQIYFQYHGVMDLSELAENDGALTFNIKVKQAPDSAATLRMDCGYPCSGELDVSNVLRSMPVETWQPFSIDLDCFSQRGADLWRIDTPFLLATSGQMALEISHIMIETNALTPAINCANQLSKTGFDPF